MKKVVLACVVALMCFSCNDDEDSPKEKVNEINAQNNKRFTPLHLAAMHDNPEIIFILIAAGADVNVKDDFGCTPLKYTRSNGYKKIIKILKAAGAKDDI